MPETTARELKLIQYLNEAYGKEKQLETALQAQIKIAQRPPLKKRLQDHLKETKAQSKNLERRIKALGGKAEKQAVPGPDIVGDAVSAGASVANKAMAAAKGPVQALRGTGVADNQLRNVRDAYWNEAEEIAHYAVIEAAADQLGDKETVKLAREHRRQEERMQSFLEKEIPKLIREVIKEEVPKEDRQASGNGRRSSSSRSSSSRSTSRSSSSRSTSRSSSSSSSSRSSGGASARKSGGASARKSGGSSTRKSGGSSARKSGGSSSRKSSGSSSS
jgi:ferritin-like metal-binding protein YciE